MSEAYYINKAAKALALIIRAHAKRMGKPMPKTQAQLEYAVRDALYDLLSAMEAAL